MFFVENALETQRTRRDLCPDPCSSKSYNLIVSTVKPSDDLFLTSGNYSEDNFTVSSELNRVVNSLDKTRVAFFGGQHSMWAAVEFLGPMMEEYYMFLDSLIQLAFDDQ